MSSTSEKKKSMSDKVIDILAGENDKTPTEQEKPTVDDNMKPVSSDSLPKKRKPGVNPADEQAEPHSVAEAKEKVQDQVNDVLERQKNGDFSPPKNKNTDVPSAGAIGAISSNNGSKSSISESPLKKQVVETEEMVKSTDETKEGSGLGQSASKSSVRSTEREVKKKEASIKSNGKGEAVAAGAGASAVAAGGAMAAGAKSSNGSNPSLRDSSLMNGSVTSPVVIHSGTMYKQGKFLPCIWKHREFQLFSNGELKWYLPGNSATVKGIMPKIDSTAVVTPLPNKKVSISRPDKTKVPLHMFQVKSSSGKAMVIGVESDQELTTFAEKAKQITTST